MRISINYTNVHDLESTSRFAYLFLAEDEFPNAKAVTFEGNVAAGLAITDDGTPRRNKNYAVYNNGSSRVVRVPEIYLAGQPEGCSMRPKSVSFHVSDERLLVIEATRFLPSEMTSRRGVTRARGHAPEDIKPVQAFQTPDGQVFTTADAARVHLRALHRRDALASLSGKGVLMVTESEHGMVIGLEDGSSLVITGPQIDFEINT